MAKGSAVPFKAMVLRLKSWRQYITSKWKVLLVFVLCGLAAGAAYYAFSKPIYSARLTFVLYEENKMGSLSSLAGQLGLDVGNTENSAFNGDNIIELLKSEKIIEPVLFKKIPEKNATLINCLIKADGLQKKWQRKQYLKNTVPFPNDTSLVTPVQDSLVSEICDYVIKHYLVIDKIDKKLNYYRVTSNTPDEQLSVYLTKYLVAEASDFFIETKTKLARQNLTMIVYEADSLRNLLKNTITDNSSITDKTFNLNPAYQIQRSPLQEGQVKTTVLGTAYGEVVKNLELAKINLLKETPLYQVIDVPKLPLKKESVTFVSIIAGGFIGLAIGIFLLLASKIYNELMAEEI
jgi:uncharacterized protein involved in exopolysaccharide biosynthesis